MPQLSSEFLWTGFWQSDQGKSTMRKCEAKEQYGGKKTS
jgi:hypothetical protein